MRGLAYLFMCSLLLIGVRPTAAQGTRTWQFKAPMPTARTGVSAVVLDDMVYVMGGLNAQGQILNTVERYDPATNSWQNAPNLRTARYNAAAVVYNGKIYLMGGHDIEGRSSKKVEVFVPSENDWESFDNLNDDREGLAAVVLNNELYVMGGSNGSADILDSVEHLDDDEEWDISGDWTLDVPRALFAYVTINDFAYSIGGFSTFGPIGLVQQYHETGGTIDLAPLMPGRGGLSAVMLDNSIYAMGGRQTNNQVVNTVNRFFPAENRWEQAPALKTARERFAAVLLNNQIYVFGGNDNNGAVLSSTETFAISVVPNAADDVLVTNEDAQMSINVLVNDSDPAGGALSISSFSQPAHGTVTQVNSNTFSYAPSKDYFGSDQFTYTALNQTGGTALATVNVTVQPVNDSPAFSSTPVTGAAKNTLYSYTVSAVDVDGDPLSFSGATLPDWLTLTDLQNGTALLEGTPGEQNLGDQNVVINVSDGAEQSEQQFSIIVVEGAPGEIMLLSPANGAQSEPTSLTLAWMIPGAVTFDMEVSTDEAFSSIVLVETGLNEPSYALSGLEMNTTYYWRVRGTNAAGTNLWPAPFTFTTADGIASEEELPVKPFVLHPNYPNPFNNQTRIDFEITSTSAFVKLDVFDIHGRQVVELTSGYMSPGIHQAVWDGRDASGRPMASGTYLLRFQYGTTQQGVEQQTRSLILIR